MNFSSIGNYSVLTRCLGIALFSLVVSLHAKGGEFEEDFREAVSEFLNSLDEKQTKSCMWALNDKKVRWEMKYPGGIRPGIEISALTSDQKTLMKKALSLVLSEEGWELAEQVAKLDGDQGINKYWLTCFGDPREKGAFSFRLAEHHLTIVHLEVGEGEVKEFGPVLLGSNPAKVWKEDELALIDSWTKINDPTVLIQKKSIAGKAMPKNEGRDFSSLNAEGQEAIRFAWNKRLRIFTPDIQKRINRLHKQRGGWEKSKLAFYNESPEKRCIDGGRWDFKCSLPGMGWDYEASRGHIHMSLWVKAD